MLPGQFKFNLLFVVSVLICGVPSFSVRLCGQAVQDKADSATGSKVQQDGPKKADVAERIRDYSDMTLIIQSRNQFTANAKEFLTDIGFSAFHPTVANIFDYDVDNVVDDDKPFIWYDIDSAGSIAAVPVKDAEKLIEHVLEKKIPKSAFNKPLYLSNPLIGSDWLQFPEEFGVFDGNHFLLSFRKDDLTKFQSSPFISKSIPKETRQLINESGVVLITDFSKAVGPLVIGERDRARYDEEELKSFELFTKVAESGQKQFVGVTYEKKCLEFRLQALTEKNEAAGQLINFSAAQAKGTPTLGLPSSQLIASLSSQLSVFKSPATIRMILKQIGGPNPQLGFDERMIGLSGDLFAEAWREIDTFRIGVYEIDTAVESGSLCLIGVVDPKKPDQFLDELKKFVSLIDTPTEPEQTELQRSEISKWIQQLNATSFEDRRQASARLMLAGESAEEALRKAAKSGPPEQRFRAQQILKRSQQNIRDVAKRLADGKQSVWTSVSPRYGMTKEPVKLDRFEANEIHIRLPDDEDTERVARYTNAMRSTFGKDWNRIRLVRVGDHFVFMLGSSERLLTQALNNVDAGKDPIRESFKGNRRRLNVNNQIELHFSAARVNNLLFANDGRSPVKVVKVEDKVITSLGLQIDERTWEGSIHIPSTELRTVLMNPRFWNF